MSVSRKSYNKTAERIELGFGTEAHILGLSYMNREIIPCMKKRVRRCPL